jgi:hypothetical protein
MQAERGESSSVEPYSQLDFPSATAIVGSPLPSDAYGSRFLSTPVTSSLDGSPRFLSNVPEQTFHGTISLRWQDDSMIVDYKSQIVVWYRALMMLPEAAR